jgi:probable rRNA maturation factor
LEYNTSLRMITVLLSVGSRYPVDRKKIRNFVRHFLDSRQVKDAQVSISIVGDRKIKELNEKHLGHKGVTDVLSFPQYDKGSEVDYESILDPVPLVKEKTPFIEPPTEQRNLGDVVVCFPEVVRQAMKRGKMVDDHICSLIEHSLLHLLGVHHE